MLNHLVCVWNELLNVHCTVVDLRRLFIVNYCLADVVGMYCLVGA